jgi:arsenite transporter
VPDNPGGNRDIAGLFLLAAAPCTAMVFVWRHPSNGEPRHPLASGVEHYQYGFAFAPIVGLLLGLSSIGVPRDALFLSMLLWCR